MKKKLVLLILIILAFSTLILMIGISSTSAINLDKKGRFGCLACHNDKNLSKERDGKEVSLFIDQDKFVDSVHGKLACINCHTDFSFRDHSQGVGGFKKTAGLACIRCHQHEKQYKTYLASIHGRYALSNDVRKGATCGDCHAYKIHAITKTKSYWNEYFYKADKTCGKSGCHEKYYKSYNDSYHGRAYKNKAVDAPACWDCHGNHDVDKLGEPLSKVSEENIGQTCAKCHPEDPQNIFGNSYREMIHGREKMQSTNLVIKLATSGMGVKDAAVGKVSGVYNTLTSWIKGIFEFFMPQSLRPRKDQPSSDQEG